MPLEGLINLEQIKWYEILPYLDMGMRTYQSQEFNNELIWNSKNAHEYDKHLKKTGGQNDWKVAPVTNKMRIPVWINLSIITVLCVDFQTFTHK